MNELIGLCLGIVLFLCTIVAYTLGVQHGKQLGNRIAPTIKLNPVGPLMRAMERHKEEKKAEELTDELADVMSYTKESALKAVERERLG